jgi:hypothetical protein
MNAKAAIDAAEALPDKSTRKLTADNALTQMERLNPLVTTEWEFLAFHIRKAYPMTAEAELESAGYAQFKLAITQQWGSTESMIKKAKTYMAGHMSDLLANDNMPKEFPHVFATLGDEFIAQRNIRNKALGTSETGTTDKVVANNAIYDQTLEMLEMGKLINKNNKTEYKKFVFEELKKVVRGHKPAGAKGMVKADGAFTPIGNATLSARNLNPAAQQQDYSTVSGKDGRFFLEMASGDYEITVVAQDFVTVVVPKFKVKTGMKSRLNPVLLPNKVNDNMSADAEEEV